MNVFDSQQQGAPRCGPAKHGREGLGGSALASSVVHRVENGLERRRLLDIEQLVDEEFVVRAHEPELESPAHGRSLHAGVRVFGQAKHALQEGGQRFASLAHAKVEHLARWRVEAKRLCPLTDLLDEARLSDPGLTPDDDGHAASPSPHGRQRIQDLLQLVGTTDEP